MERPVAVRRAQQASWPFELGGVLWIRGWLIALWRMRSTFFLCLEPLQPHSFPPSTGRGYRTNTGLAALLLPLSFISQYTG